MTLWNSKPQENLQSLKYLSQLRNLTCRALKGQCQRSVALSPTVLCGKICDFYRLISPFSVSAPYVSPRKAIPHRCICTTHFGCSIADRGWAHFEMMTGIDSQTTDSFITGAIFSLHHVKKYIDEPPQQSSSASLDQILTFSPAMMCRKVLGFGLGNSQNQ